MDVGQRAKCAHENFQDLEIQFLYNSIDIDDISFDERCGTGGYGEVWKARWNHKTVLIKTCHGCLLALDALRRFVQNPSGAQSEL